VPAGWPKPLISDHGAAACREARRCVREASDLKTVRVLASGGRWQSRARQVSASASTRRPDLPLPSRVLVIGRIKMLKATMLAMAMAMAMTMTMTMTMTMAIL
jgi:hypothetical protein